MQWPLQETPSRTYRQRTRWNVLDSDATLILAQRPLSGGTRLTAELAASLERPCLIVTPPTAAVEPVRLWIVERGVRTLNVAGPRESHRGDVEAVAAAWLRTLLAPFAETPPATGDEPSDYSEPA